ncbi:MAG: zf-HC2 domain-containing protein [Acidobacteria bacterium]|nr:zf-HC2 domain-containing protein [Acidobacteriota bacterium]
MIALFHERWRRQVSLLASGALEGPERRAAESHAASCPRCGKELEGIRALLALVASDPVRTTAPPVSLAALARRVEARLDAGAEAALGMGLSAPRLAAAAAVVLLALLAVLRGPTGRPSSEAPAVAETDVAVPEEMLRRLETRAARNQAVRYLAEAHDVLLTVAAAPQKCHRESDRVDVAEETQRSRALLTRRALVEMDRAVVASAQPVLEDVERVLREVAALESCARRGEVQAIHREVVERRLLMKIDLMTRELQG